MKTIGVLGGMGPESTAYAYMQMIKFCQREYNAKLDSDFPSIMIYNLPVPDVVELKDNERNVLDALEYGIDKLKAAGVDFVFIPCNSMDRFVPVLRRKTEVLSIVEETLKEMKKLGLKNAGLLATETTIASNHYQEKFEKEAINILLPENQKQVTRSIREILEGKKQEPRKRILQLINELQGRGADAVILGCTDLPLAINQEDVQIKLFDTTAIIAKAAVKKYYQ